MVIRAICILTAMAVLGCVPAAPLEDEPRNGPCNGVVPQLCPR